MISQISSAIFLMKSTTIETASAMLLTTIWTTESMEWMATVIASPTVTAISVARSAMRLATLLMPCQRSSRKPIAWICRGGGPCGVPKAAGAVSAVR